MELESSIRFDHHDDCSEVEVFYIEKGGKELPFFIQIYQNNASEGGIVQRPTDATEQEYVDFVERFLDDPEFDSTDYGLYAHSDGMVLSRESESDEGGILTYRGPMDEEKIQDLYIEGSEPLSRSEYDDVIRTGMEDLKKEFEENNVEF